MRKIPTSGVASPDLFNLAVHMEAIYPLSCLALMHDVGNEVVLGTRETCAGGENIEIEQGRERGDQVDSKRLRDNCSNIHPMICNMIRGQVPGRPCKAACIFLNLTRVLQGESQGRLPYRQGGG